MTGNICAPIKSAVASKNKLPKFSPHIQQYNADAPCPVHKFALCIRRLCLAL